MRSGGTWAHEATLRDPDPSPLWLFGRSVSASGNRLLVGSLKEGGPGFDGAAHIFTRSGTTWQHEATLRASPVVRYDHFGSSVSLLGDRALIGAIRDGGSGADSGAAYLFTQAGGSWVQEARLAPTRLIAGDSFGWSVSLGEGRALVGAPARQSSFDSSTREGAAYSFVPAPDGTWALESWLASTEGPGNNGLGYSVSLLADQILVGAPFGSGAGRAHLFSRAGGAWQQTDVVVAADSAAGDRFGSAVALSNGRALIGAGGANVADRPGAGAAYVFSGVGPTGLDSEPAARVSLSPPWPNPVTQRAELTLALDRPQYVRAVLIDVLGREVALLYEGEAVGTLALRIDGGGLAPGMYVVRVSAADEVLARRLTVAR